MGLIHLYIGSRIKTVTWGKTSPSSTSNMYVKAFYSRRPIQNHS